MLIRGLIITAVAWSAIATAHAQPSDTAIARAHRNAIVIDAHVDLPQPYDWVNGVVPEIVADQASLDKLRAGGVDAAIFSVFVAQSARTPELYQNARREANAKLDAIRRLATAHPDRAEIALTPGDVRRIAARGKTAILIGLLNAYPLGTDTSAIADFYARGVRVLGFTHAGNNAYADSSRPQARDTANEHGGLSSLGRAAVAEANRLGLLIDVSQLSTQALLQTTGLTRAPVIASHSGVRALVDSTRNLTDEEIDAIKATGGVVGIVAFSSYLKTQSPESQEQIRQLRARYGAVNGYEGLSREKREALGRESRALQTPASVSDLVDQVDYVVRRVGVDHVAISSDYNHGGGIIGWQDESEARNVTAELLKRGYSTNDVAKIWGGNLLRALGAAQRAANQS